MPGFSLKPFPGQGDRPDIRISGTIGRRADTLSLHCAILGAISELAIPLAEGPPARKNLLWGATCLELFLGAKGSGGYWEFNLSPAGHWNVYRFTSYRENRQQDPAFSSLPFGVRHEPDAVASLATELIKGKTADEALALGIDQLAGGLGPLPPMKIHCAELVQGALRSALSHGPEANASPVPAPPAPANASPSLLDSFSRPKEGVKLVFLKDEGKPGSRPS